MTFTYNSASIGTNLVKVRLRLGDTNSDDALLTDEEINHYLDVAEDDLPTAAVMACRAIVAKFARVVNDSAAGINSSKTSKFSQYRDLLRELEEEVRSRGAAQPFVGGISIDREDDADDDTDLRRNSFEIGMTDTPGGDDPEPAS